MELFRALGALCEPPSPAHARLAAALGLPGPPANADHTDLFLFRLYPYASVYLGAEGRLGGEARDRVAGFWRALGLIPPAEPDHLAALLGLVAALAEAEAAEPDTARRRLVHEARGVLLHEHLLTWTGPFLDRVQELGSPAYRAWAALLRDALAEEAERLGARRLLAVALRDAPALEPPDVAGGARFLGQLLAPVRTGCILVGDDLLRAGRELGLGVRIAERRFVLEALLAQDAPATLRWLAAFAAGWAARHPPGFWRERADATAALLAHAAEAAAHEQEVATAG
jgi:TorA maturation chaperone TorD